MKRLLKKLGFSAILIAFLGGAVQAQVADFEYLNPCEGQTTTFVSTSTYPSGITSYWWNFDDGSMLIQGQEVEHLYTNSNVYSVSLRVYNSALGADSLVSVKTKNVAIYNLPNASFTATVACDGEPVVFTNSSVSSEGAMVSWVWDFGDGEGDLLENVEHLYAEPGQYPVSLTVETEYGCKDDFSADVAVFQLPNATIFSDDFEVCEGDTIQLHVDDTYQKVIWSTPPSLTSPNVEAFKIGVAYSPGVYTVIASVYEVHATYPFFQVCKSETEVEVIVSPTPDISIAVTDEVIIPGEAIPMEVVSTNTELVSFQWLPLQAFANPYIAKPTAQVFETTEFEVTVVDQYGCVNTAKATVEVDLEPNNLLTPNGDGKNDTWFVSGKGLSQDFEVVIYNRWGAEVFAQKGYNNEWDGNSNGEALPEGAYYYIIKNQDAVYTGSISLLR